MNQRDIFCLCLLCSKSAWFTQLEPRSSETIATPGFCFSPARDRGDFPRNPEGLRRLHRRCVSLQRPARLASIHTLAPPPPLSGHKLSAVSLSRPAWVKRSCFALSVATYRGWERQANLTRGRTSALISSAMPRRHFEIPIAAFARRICSSSSAVSLDSPNRTRTRSSVPVKWKGTA